MGTRHPNYRLVKIHRTYTVNEIARLFQIHPNTVRAWRRQGLQAIDGRRPILFKGATLVAFLRARREKAKRPCSPGEIFCLPCRSQSDLLAALWNISRPHRPLGTSVASARLVTG